MMGPGFYDPNTARAEREANEIQGREYADQALKNGEECCDNIGKCCVSTKAKAWCIITATFTGAALATYIASEAVDDRSTKNTLQDFNKATTFFAFASGIMATIRKCIQCFSKDNQPSTNVNNTDIEMGRRDIERY